MAYSRRGTRCWVDRRHQAEACVDRGWPRTVPHLRKNAPFLECFPYVCPEPVLVKWSVLMNEWRKKWRFSHRCSRAHQEREALWWGGLCIETVWFCECFIVLQCDKTSICQDRLGTKNVCKGNIWWKRWVATPLNVDQQVCARGWRAFAPARSTPFPRAVFNFWEVPFWEVPKLDPGENGSFWI